MAGDQFPKLFEPGRIGGMTLRNRLVMPAIGSNLAAADGQVTERMIDYYAERSRGGAGLVIVELAIIELRGKHVAAELSIEDDDCLPGLSRLVDGIHKGGARAAIQIAHAGREAKAGLAHAQPVGPSPVPSWATNSEMPRELTVAEIAGLVDLFARAAVRAQKAGFDGVEVHGAHYYLITQFLSAASNVRTDAYGGNLRNRVRFLLETLDACRQELGRDYPVWCRLNGQEYGMENGITLDETIATAKWAQEHGADAIHMTAVGKGQWLHLPFTKNRGEIMHLVSGVKKAVDIPVIAVGSIDLKLAEQVLRNGQADFVSIGRGIIADPELPGKAAEGRAEEIRPCIMCLECLNAIMFQGAAIRCSVNAACGRERQYAITPAARARKVLVVGGGPAGLEAARVAALRGHQVTLWERSDRLGGQLHTASLPPGKALVRELAAHLAARVARLGVRVESGREATGEAVRSLQPDVVVLAAGAAPIIPEIPGIEGANVVMAGDVLSGKAIVGEKVIVLGGDLVGCETADFLLEQGRKVVVTRRGPRMATSMMPILRRLLLDKLAARGVELLTGVQYREVNSRGLVIVSKDGRERLLEADTIVLAAGSAPDDGLKAELSGQAPELHVIGDCVEPRNIMAAIEEGRRVGCSI